MNKELLNVKEAASFLKIKVPTIYRYVCDKRIPHIKIGSRTMFDPEDLKKWIEDRKVKAIGG